MKNQHNQLPPIETIEDLRMRIRHTKMSLREQERDLEERWKRLPQETLRSTIGAVIPIFLSNRLASGAWGLIRQGMSFFIGSNNKEGTWKEKIAGPAKQIGFFAALKGLYALLKRKS